MAKIKFSQREPGVWYCHPERLSTAASPLLKPVSYPLVIFKVLPFRFRAVWWWVRDHGFDPSSNICIWIMSRTCVHFFVGGVVHCSVVSNSFILPYPRVLGRGCHSLLQTIFPTQTSDLHLLHWQADSLPLSHQGSLTISLVFSFSSPLKWE